MGNDIGFPRLQQCLFQPLHPVIQTRVVPVVLLDHSALRYIIKPIVLPMPLVGTEQTRHDQDFCHCYLLAHAQQTAATHLSQNYP